MLDETLLSDALSPCRARRRRADEALKQSINTPGHVLRLLQLAQLQLARHAPAQPLAPTALLAAQLLHRSVRRAPLPELDAAAEGIFHLIGVGKHWSACLTQLGLAATVTVIRCDHPPLELLDRLQRNFECNDAADRNVVLCLLRLLGEELHSPAGRLSVAPGRVDLVSAQLRERTPSVLAQLHDWLVEAASSSCTATAPGAALELAAAVLRTGGAWCAAGLCGAECALSSPLLIADALEAMLTPRLAEDASDAHCAALAVILAPGGAPAAVSQTLLASVAARIELMPPHSREAAAVCCTVCEGLARSAELLVLEPALAQWTDLLLRATESLALDDAGLALDCWAMLAETAAAAEHAGGPLVRAVSMAQPRLLKCMVRSSLLVPNVQELAVGEVESWSQLREEQRGWLRSIVFLPNATREGPEAALRQTEPILRTLWSECRNALQAWAGLREAESTAEPHWIAVEAVLHAVSASAKSIGCIDSEAVGDLMRALPTIGTYCAALLADTGSEAAGRALLTATLLLPAAFASWLGVTGREGIVAEVLPLLFWSLGVPELPREETPTGNGQLQPAETYDCADARAVLRTWPLRSMQEHAGAVALLKLSAQATASLETSANGHAPLIDALHRAYFANNVAPSPPPLSRGSARLLLQAAATSASHAASCGRDAAGALLSAHLEQLARAASARPLDEFVLVHVLETIAQLLDHCAPALHAECAALFSPHVSSLSSWILHDSTRIAHASCGLTRALFAKSASPLLVPALAASMLQRFDAAVGSNVGAADGVSECRVIVGATRCLLLSLHADEVATSSESAIAAARLIATIAMAIARSVGGGSPMERLLVVDWFGLVEACAASETASRLVTSIIPKVLSSIRVTFSTPVEGLTHEEESPETSRAAQPVRSAMLVLQRVVPPTPLGGAMGHAMRAPAPGVLPEASSDTALGSALVRALVLALCHWMPSWLLGDAAWCLWHLRMSHGNESMGRWLGEALDDDDVPRRSVSSVKKHELSRCMLEAANWSAFKAALKQLCGGKKKRAVP